jgi:excisionase family DNA binding protein
LSEPSLQPGGLLEQLVTAAQLAERLHMKRSTVEDYARRAVIPSLKLGRHRRFIVSDVEATLQTLRDEGRWR